MCVEDVEWGGSSGKIYTYHSTGARHGLLKGQVRESREPIYECHGECACVARACKNRVVEHGRTVGLVIFRTANRGWGESNR